MVRIINIDTKTRTIRVNNGKDELEWFTTDTGSHVPLKKGQSKTEAIKEHFGDKKTKQQPAKKVKETYADTSEIDGAEVFKDGDEYVVLYANGTKTREFSSKTEADKFAKSLSKQPAAQDKGIEEGYTEDDILYEEAYENIKSKYDDDDIAPNGYSAAGFLSPQEYDARQKRMETEIEKEFKRLKAAKQQPAKQGKGTDENGTVWIKMGGAIIPLRDGVSVDDIDPKMLATPEEIKRGRAKYEGIKDRQDAARAKAKSSKIMRE